MNAEIRTDRFVLRDLTLADVTQQYLNWLGEPVTRQFISTAADVGRLNELSEYVGSRINRDDVLFLGIFVNSSGQHIGNIKFEPVDVRNGYAVMGILIGEPAWRGKGVGPEVIAASAYWLRDNLGISEVVLGVEKQNLAAVRAYRSIGFEAESTKWINVDPDSAFTMVWRLRAATDNVE